MSQEQFRKILLEYKEENNLSRKQLANRLNVSESLVGAYERGERKIPLEIAENLCLLANRTVTIPFLLEQPIEPQNELTGKLNALIKEEQIKRNCSLNEVFQEIENSLNEIQGKIKEKEISKELLARKLIEIGNARYFFIEPNCIESIWYTDDLTDLEEEEEEGYIWLTPLMYYEKIEVKKSDILQINRENAMKLIKNIVWKEDLEYELSEEYKEFANEIIKVKN